MLQSRSPLLVALALCAAALLYAPTAWAAPVEVKAGSTVVQVKKAAAAKLKARGVKVAANRPGRRVATRKPYYTLPVTGANKGYAARWDFANATGSVRHYRGKAGVRFAHGRRKAVIHSLLLKVSAKKATVGARVGKGPRITAFTATTKSKRTVSTAANQKVDRVVLKLTAKAAKRLNRALRTKAFKRGQAIAQTETTLARPGVSDPNDSRNGVLPGTASFALANPLPGLLQRAGLDFLPILPGVTEPGTGAVVFPVEQASGNIAGGQGTVNLRGGFVIDGGALGQVRVENPTIALGINQSALYADVNGVEVKLSDLSSEQVLRTVEDGVTTISLAGIRLTPESAALLNRLSASVVFDSTQSLGDLTVRVQSADVGTDT